MSELSGLATEAIVAALREADLPVDHAHDGALVTQLPGEHKLSTTVSLAVGERSLAVDAFVARHPQENHEQVYRWLLERNRRLSMVCYAIDGHGDIYLTGRVPLIAVTPQTVDELLGIISITADEDFDVLVAMGYETAIRREWEWRLSRGESTRNLEAFAHLAPKGPDAAGSGP